MKVSNGRLEERNKQVYAGQELKIEMIKGRNTKQLVCQPDLVIEDI